MSPTQALTRSASLELATPLFAQAECDRVVAAAGLVRDHGVGVVYTVQPRRRGHRRSDAHAAIVYSRAHAPGTEILIDSNLYSGNGRNTAGGILGRPSTDWITFQRKHGLKYALTDSGYIAAGKTLHLSETLRGGAKLGKNVITALPLATRWLTHDADILCDKVSKFQTPVALMMEDKNDPFDRKNAAAGLIAVIRTGVPVLLLPADSSALGAIAHGAAAGAIGATSSLRHFYPLPTKNDSGGPDPAEDRLAFVIPTLLGYFRNQRFLNAFDVDPDNPAWRCGCCYCNGAPLTRISNAGRHDLPQPAPTQLGLQYPHEFAAALPPITEPTRHGPDPRSDAAFQHSLAAIAALRDELIDIAARTGAGTAAAWSLMCETAQTQHFTIETADGKGWEPRAALGRWRDLATVPVELPPPASSPERERRGTPPST